MKSTKKQIKAKSNPVISDLHYHHLFDTLRQGVLIVDRSTSKIADVNPFFISLIGYSRAELIGKNITELSYTQNQDDSKKTSIRTKDDIKINVEVSSSEFKLHNVEYVTYFFKDITELSLKNRELSRRIKTLIRLSKFQEKTNEIILNITEDLETAKNLLDIEKSKDEAILASIADAVIACDTNGNIFLFNKSAEVLTGIPSLRAIGANYEKIIKVFDGVNDKIYKDLITKTLNKDIKSDLLYMFSSGGKKIYLAVSAAKIVREQNNPIGYVLIFHDISKEIEVDKVKSEFVSIASHQLRTPLTAINWTTENLISGVLGTLQPSQIKGVTDVLEASKRMVNLIDAFLNVSRLEMGTIKVFPEKLRISEAVKTCLKELEPRISAKKLIILENYNSKNSTYVTDPKLLNIVLLNLLSNATKYTLPAGKIYVTTRSDKKILYIVIKDSGIGIPSYEHKMIFTKLFRADNAREIDSSGTGLGLYIVKEVLTSLNGKIYLESESGKGATFTVALPINGSRKILGSNQLIVNI